MNVWLPAECVPFMEKLQEARGVLKEMTSSETIDLEGRVVKKTLRDWREGHQDHRPNGLSSSCLR